MEDSNNSVTLNGKEMTQEELKEATKTLEKKPGVTVVQTGENEFRTRLHD